MPWNMIARFMLFGGCASGPSRSASSTARNTTPSPLPAKNRKAEDASAFRVTSTASSSPTGRRGSEQAPMTAIIAKSAPVLFGLTISIGQLLRLLLLSYRKSEGRRTGPDKREPRKAEDRAEDLDAQGQVVREDAVEDGPAGDSDNQARDKQACAEQAGYVIAVAVGGLLSRISPGCP
jgi:hypothetical protein